MEKEMVETLIKQALEAREKAHAPYSKYKVGAALLGRSGTIYTGCNVENASYGLTVCAERIAFFKAISEGEKDFSGIAVATPNGAPPCGACLQVMAEFVEDFSSFQVILVSAEGESKILTLRELYPFGFTSRFLWR
ncbi:MAG: cytidine deaminase [Anaerolineae bacterium]|nr:cytidine deaminase [Anaerolineae bacterium]MDW8101732.1 cytidine deaminase [Anaerolineae bacterium]